MDGNYNDFQQPTTCEFGTRFTLDHALSCKKGGFISLRHNQIRDLTVNLLKTMCHDVLIEPTLQQLTGESLHERTANITDDARVDITARGLWISGLRVFFDIRVFSPMARRYESQELNKAYEINQREKKRQYNLRGRTWCIYPIGHDSPWWYGKGSK